MSEKFVTPKGDDFSDSDGGTVTIATKSTFTTASALAFAAKGVLGDVTAGTSGKVVCAFEQPTKMRVQAEIKMAPSTTSETDTLDMRIYDSKNSVEVGRSSEGPTSATNGTDKTFTLDVVQPLAVDAELVVQVTNNSGTGDVAISSAKLSVWHP